MSQANQNQNQNSNPNPQHPFWDFVSSMENLGIHSAATNTAHNTAQPNFTTPFTNPQPAPAPAPQAAGSGTGWNFNIPHPPHPPHPPPPGGHPGRHGGGPGHGYFDFGRRGGYGAAWAGPTGEGFNGAWSFGGGRHGRRGRHHRRRRSLTPSSNSSRSASPHSEGEEEAHSHPHGPHDHPPHGHPPHGHPPHGHPPHGPHPHGPPPHFHHGRGRHGRGHPRGPPPPFDMSAVINNLPPAVRDVLANLIPQTNATRNGNGTDTATNEPIGDETTFTPPLDIFTTPTAYTLHISLPGAKKEDIGVHYSANISTLTISGVVYRPCNEEFLATMTSSERRVGMFERKVILQEDEGGEVDSDGITARLEDGVLVVTVPRVEKEWEDVKTVEID